MGLRSWFTPVRSFSDFKKAVRSIEKNPYSYGIHFVLKMDKHREPFFDRTVLIAWSGDGTSSLMKLTPKKLISETWLLDNLDEVFVDDPPSLGTIFESVDEINESIFLIKA